MIPNASNKLWFGIALGLGGLLLFPLGYALYFAYDRAILPVLSLPSDPSQTLAANLGSPAVPVALESQLKPASRFPPGYNFALAANGGKATGGTNPQLLIDGNTTDYDGGRGFAYTNWTANPPQSFLIELAEPSEIDCIRFLLWDIEENRYYRYKLEVADSAEGTNWAVVADKTGKYEECRSWQVHMFEKRSVKLIRLTGTFNTTNSKFHVVELQACLAPPNGFPRNPTQQSPSKEHLQVDELQF